MNYVQSLRFLNSLDNFERLKDPKKNRFLNLDRMHSCLEHLDHPEQSFPSVLVGGTKGKGSVSFYLARSLQASGYRVGLYTSPHLEDVRERIVVTGQKISKSDFARLSSQLRNDLFCEGARRRSFNGQNTEILALPRDIASSVASSTDNSRSGLNLTYAGKDYLSREGMPRDPALGKVTYFEFLTLLAFLYFKEKKVSLAVLEVGLGGRLDATNCVDPLLTVLTPISLDHTQVLGNTLSKIAQEKSFLIHSGRPVITARQEPSARNVINARCKKMRSLVITVTSRAKLPAAKKIKPLYALENFSLVLRALQLLKERYKFSKVSVLKAVHVFQRATWPGRFELVQEHPGILLDGAHNGASARRLVESVQYYYPKQNKILILAVAKDKDVKGILSECWKLKPDLVIATSFKNPRALPASKLAELARKRFGRLRVEKVDDLKNVLKDFKKIKHLDMFNSLFIITGSLYLVGEARKILKLNERTT